MPARLPQPAFGLLQGYRVVMIGLSVAAPFAGELFAEHGAEVIWVENPKAIDSSRVARRSGAWQQDRRNMRSLSLDYVHGTGRDVFARLIETADVLIEASVGGRFAKIGYSDEFLWQLNPGLVIAHISGFGQTGDPSYVGRASYDPIAQAFGCVMRMNGLPGQPSAPAMPFPADYAAGMFAFGMANAALVKRQQTGRGESIDVAQFELMMRLQANYPTDYYRYGLDYTKEGNHSRICAMYGTYAAADGEEVYVLVLGAGVVPKVLALLDLEYGGALFPTGSTFIPVETEAAQVLEAAFAEFLSIHTAAEVEEILAGAGVPCSRLMDYESARTHPQYVARGVITEWTAADGVTPIPGVKVVPDVAGHPGRVWRGAPTVGMDNDEILSDLGISEQIRDELYAAGQLTRREYFETTGS
jgi:Predicted acyl-CoA transferases/carnitine dehydratase